MRHIVIYSNGRWEAAQLNDGESLRSFDSNVHTPAIFSDDTESGASEKATNLAYQLNRHGVTVQEMHIYMRLRVIFEGKTS